MLCKGKNKNTKTIVLSIPIKINVSSLEGLEEYTCQLTQWLPPKGLY